MIAIQKTSVIEENKIELIGQILKQRRKYLIVHLQRIRKKFFSCKINLKNYKVSVIDNNQKLSS